MAWSNSPASPGASAVARDRQITGGDPIGYQRGFTNRPCDRPRQPKRKGRDSQDRRRQKKGDHDALLVDQRECLVNVLLDDHSPAVRGEIRPRGDDRLAAIVDCLAVTTLTLHGLLHGGRLIVADPHTNLECRVRLMPWRSDESQFLTIAHHHHRIAGCPKAAVVLEDTEHMLVTQLQSDKRDDQSLRVEDRTGNECCRLASASVHLVIRDLDLQQGANPVKYLGQLAVLERPVKRFEPISRSDLSW